MSDAHPNHDIRKRPEDFESCMRYVLKELEVETIGRDRIETLCNALRRALGVPQVVKPSVGVVVSFDANRFRPAAKE